MPGRQTSSGRLAVAGSGWFGCETADVAAERWGEAHRQHDSRHCQQEHGHLRPEARLTLKLGRQATGGAATTPSEFQRGPSSALRPAGSVLRAQKRRGCNGEGGHTSQSEQPYQPHCHVPVWRGTRLRLGAPDGGVQAGWQTSSGWLVMADSGWFGCETAGMAAKRRVRPTDSAAGRSMDTCGPAALKLGRQATTTPREFRHDLDSTLQSIGSVLQAAGHRNGGGATVRATTHAPAVATCLARLHCGCGLVRGWTGC